MTEQGLEAREVCYEALACIHNTNYQGLQVIS